MKQGTQSDPKPPSLVDSGLPAGWNALIAEVNGLPLLGTPGVRDIEFPCEAYEPGAPNGECEADGHYLCLRCKHLDLAAWDLLKGPGSVSGISDETGDRK